MTENTPSHHTSPPQSVSRSWPRLLLGLLMGGLIGIGLAWFASEMRTAEDAEAEENPLGTGDLVNLGIEVLALVRTLFRLLKRM